MDGHMAEGKDIEILVVEDSPTQAEHLKFILEKRGFKVSAAPDGKKALALMAKHKPDIVITDIIMPEMDGYELCRRIGSDPNLADIPVIFVTTLTDPTDVIKGLQVGANNFITKPYDEEHLVSRIDYLIANKSLREDSAPGEGVTVVLSGQTYHITADRPHILDLLLSTYENSYRQNRRLVEAQNRLRELNELLEETIQERDVEIAERKRMEAKLQNARDELEHRVEERTAEVRHLLDLQQQAEAQLRQAQKMEAIGTLAGGIAHDFNNILAGIIGFAEMALDDLPEENPVRRHIELVLKGGFRGRDLVKQILSFSRLTGHERKSVSVGQVIEETFKLLRPALPSTIEIQTRLHRIQDTIFADPVQIHQVFMNLCTNAAHAMRDAGGKLDVTLADAELPDKLVTERPDLKPGAYIRLSVRDTGCGMTPEVLEKIFDPFFTTKAPGEGTGMGLSVVHGIVQSHGGHIIVQSEPGAGSTFHVYLPKVSPGATANRAAQEPVRGGNERILFVDDEEMIVELNCQRLRSLGYKVVGTRSGAEALNTFAAEPSAFDLVITDYTMPHMTGAALARRLREIRPDIPIILSSGLNERVDSEAITQMGVSAFIGKAIERRDLAEVVRRVLDGGRQG